jgi:hypothetical protein
MAVDVWSGNGDREMWLVMAFYVLRFYYNFRHCKCWGKGPRSAYIQQHREHARRLVRLPTYRWKTFIAEKPTYLPTHPSCLLSKCSARAAGVSLVCYRAHIADGSQRVLLLPSYKHIQVRSCFATASDR